MFRLISTLCFLTMTISEGMSQEILLLKTTGKVVVGDTSQIATPDGYNLFVQNGVLTEKVKVAIKNTSEWSDDAWHMTPTLGQVANKIESDGHLPYMPSAQDLVEKGYEVTDMDAKLLAQIEWLWQHVIAMKSENEALKKELEAVKKSNPKN